MAITEQIKTNYSFILKCMAALATGALLTLGIVAAFMMKTTALVAPILFSAVATGVAGGMAVAAAPILPIVAMLAILGGICLLPFCFGNSCTASRHVHTASWGTPFSFYPPASSHVHSGSILTGGHVHGHSQPHSGPYHSHSHSGNHHGHDFGSTHHGHF
ncbi:hypothetical protein [Legionella jamestowniensis]|uniref:Transmembrane protein n=1 Tax=Legionella jamestowniensis TaxID=455 RepID=A0A0W0UG79_9GAMM|nr:hypothetical protein [Legionella jamestowniensis]KTD06928.1 hypothetical protein Ljam_1123 [Legionella jamestowniensis]SFL84982.1 hypothetical protein SAMN02746073_2245 [Legionella jamestowniensis DSM 19215]